MEATFRDRRHAGRLLADRLADLADEDLVVLALPRGGVPVGLEVALRFGADLDVLVVRKIGVPGREELALGAVGSDGALAVNHQIARMIAVDPRDLQAVADSWAPELARRADVFRQGQPPQPITGRTAVVVDDGIATGASMRAALDLARDAQPDRLVVAVPVAPPDTCAELSAVADRVECLLQPEDLGSVGAWYSDFSQLTDGDVRELLDVVPLRKRA
jgi:putative phosphoribosyl transferase